MTSKNKQLELRMYFLTMYNVSSIQKAIQPLHAVVEYSLKYGKDKNYINWAKTHKTVIILNGGTSNNGKNSYYGVPKQLGSMEQHFLTLKDNKIKCASFYEPDLNYAMSAIAFLVDERVFNKEDYPDFVFTSKEYEVLEKKPYVANMPGFQLLFDQAKTKAYKHYTGLVGKDVAFLKEFLKPFKFA